MKDERVTRKKSPSSKKRSPSKSKEKTGSGARKSTTVARTMTPLISIGRARARLVREPLRFLIEAQEPRASVTARMRQLLGPRTQVRPLFAGFDARRDLPRMQHFFVATVPGLHADEIGGNVYDLGYEIEKITKYASVKPDVRRSTSSASLPCNSTRADSENQRWAFENVKGPQAHAHLRSLNIGLGSGLIDAHIDTGWLDHDELFTNANAFRLRLDLARDFIDSSNQEARDKLTSEAQQNFGHGTATAAVLLGSGANKLIGVAPEASLAPLRVTRNVVLFSNAVIAEAFHHATTIGADVISMSLGGFGSEAIELALNNAVMNNQIVATAAGNCVPWVVDPAIYDNCIAVAGTNDVDEPWTSFIGLNTPGTARGPKVDICAPGELVWVAKTNDGDSVTNTGTRTGQGTSFATPHVTGAALLWLSRCSGTIGPKRGLVPALPVGVLMQDVFRAALRGTARRPNGWDTHQFGAGILDCEALVKNGCETRWFDQASASRPNGVSAAMMQDTQPLRWFQNMFEDREAVTLYMSTLLNASSRSDLETKVRRYSQEVMQTWYEHPGLYGIFAEGVRAVALAATAATAAVAAQSAAERVRQLLNDLGEAASSALKNTVNGL